MLVCVLLSLEGSVCGDLEVWIGPESLGGVAADFSSNVPPFVSTTPLYVISLLLFSVSLYIPDSRLCNLDFVSSRRELL